MEATEGSVEREPLVALLAEVVEHGAPAQQEQARSLRALLEGGEASADVQQQAIALVDAYRNDPYLWR